MKGIPRNVLSALLSVVFVVVSVTGVMMYFKMRMFSIQTLHIWLGFAFALVGCLHLFKNWQGFCFYFKKRSTLVSVLLGVSVTLAFILIPLINPQTKSPSPKNQLFSVMMQAPLSKVAAFMDKDADQMLKALAHKQIVASYRQSVAEIAQSNNRSSDEVLRIVFNAATVE